MRDPEPTLDEYFQAATGLARVVREAFNDRTAVTREQLRLALERFERVDLLAASMQRD